MSDNTPDAHAGVDIVTFGQYLQPTPKHLPVKEMVTPENFEHWRRYGEDVVGFRCAFSPFRSPASSMLAGCHSVIVSTANAVPAAMTAYVYKLLTSNANAGM